MCEMTQYLSNCATAYYEGTPILTDSEFDYLAKVFKFEQMGAAPLREGSLPHLNRLYSLEKFYTGSTLPLLKNPIESPKLDGAAISLLYVGGKLTKVATRGDGLVGEDITDNFLGWEGVPQVINCNGAETTQVVGELVARKTIDNARNYASGASRLKSREEFNSRDVQFIAYSVFNETKLWPGYYLEEMAGLQQWGFTTVLKEGLTAIYPTDGIVYRENSNKDYQAAGFTSKHPKGAFALKDANDVEVVMTELLDVIWQVGKSGKVSPVAILEPIHIGGALVSKATLNNVGFIEDMKVQIGDTLLVTRSGSIIPKILGVAVL